jgi:amino acid transporter
MLALFGDVIQLWQLIPLVILIGLIIFWVQYRKRQY